MAVLPNTFVAGAQKSGTTTFHRFLETHPDIFFPSRIQGEFHFFDIDENYAKGLDWLSAQYQDWQGEKILAQVSPLYMYEAVVPGRIQEAVPAAKFIFILRDPVDRAYSHYWHSVGYGYEQLSFEEALDQEAERIAQGFFQRRAFSYVDRGRYGSQIARFVECFPAENLLVLRFDELRDALEKVGDACARFLAIDRDGFEINPMHHNTFRLPRSNLVQKWSVPLQRRSRRLGRFITRINRKRSTYPPMAEETRARLRREFAEEIS